MIYLHWWTICSTNLRSLLLSPRADLKTKYYKSSAISNATLKTTSKPNCLSFTKDSSKSIGSCKWHPTLHNKEAPMNYWRHLNTTLMCSQNWTLNMKNTSMTMKRCRSCKDYLTKTLTKFCRNLLIWWRKTWEWTTTLNRPLALNCHNVCTRSSGTNAVLSCSR